MAAAFRLSDSQRERGVVIGGDDLPPRSPAFIRVLPRAGEPAIALYEGRRGRHRTAGGSPVFANTRCRRRPGREIGAASASQLTSMSATVPMSPIR
jgi:hypothetical protein